ncbi:MAG: DNA-binding protein [Rhizobiales bacterium]|nr:DNA-binding protein [Hyphomicrobiales bacterium]
MTDDRKGDLLYGVKAIAEHLGVTERRAQYLKDKGSIPTFYLDSTVCSRRSLLNEWLDKIAERTNVA